MRVGARGVTPSFAILREGGMTEKIYQERIIRHCLKKNVPAGSNAYLRICYFLKKSQPYQSGKKMKPTYLETTVFLATVCPVRFFAPAKTTDGTF